MTRGSQQACLLRIAIDIPLRKSFDYCLPSDWDAPLPVPGTRVKVPFGRKSAIGILLYTHEEPTTFKLKAIEQVLDDHPVFDHELLQLLRWAAGYYCHAVGEVLASALPLRLRQGKPARKQTIDHWVCNSGIADSEAMLTRAPKQQALYDFIAGTESGCNESDLSDHFINWRAPLKALLDKKLIQQTHTQQQPSTVAYQPPAYHLNPAQQAALDQLAESFGHFRSLLLHGVTGSGKTEVYLQASWQVLQHDQQVLILVPEIGLTPQLVASFQSRFTTPIAILHSGLNDTERLNAWLDARDGNARIIIGTRSAVFVPLLRPGLIIVDEEHDSSFKQMEGFRYSARDIAIKRAAMLNIPVLLGSATPSLESFANVVTDKSTLLSLPERTGNASHPDIYRLDLRGHKLSGGLLPHALKQIEAELDRGGQVLIFLNRRGYAPALLCNHCGWIAECHHCDIRLTVHQRDARLRCHVCSYETALPKNCPQCDGEQLSRIGYGTEKLEDVLRERFPDTGIVRIDRDSTRRKNAFKQIIQSVRSGENRILIGTQMLAKGHHFPQVGTVIIVDADNGLYGLDFRAQEYMAQLITQVSGRAGRENRDGQVFIQTAHPDHPFFDALQNLSYYEFSQNLLKERQLTGMPPYSYLALLRAESRQMADTEDFINQASHLAGTLLGEKIERLGPAIAPLERKAGYFRMQLLLKAADRNTLHQRLNDWILSMGDISNARKIRWSIDIDPYNLY
jgi:primosomal protein N' (replication factor Y)